MANDRVKAGPDKADRVLGAGYSALLCILCAIFPLLAVFIGIGAWTTGHTIVAMVCALLVGGAIWLALYLRKRRRRLTDYDFT